jgi:hypothetical protein
MSLANLKKLKVALDLVKSGLLKVTRSGSVFRLIDNQWVEVGEKKGKDAYRTFRLWVVSLQRTVVFSVHRLVWAVYRGIPATVRQIINHKNLIKEDCRLRNLECVTQAKNVKHAVDNGAYIPSQGEDQHLAVFSNKDASLARELFSKGDCTLLYLASKFGVSKYTMGNLLAGRTYSKIAPEHFAACRKLLDLRSTKKITEDAYGNLARHMRRLRARGFSDADICAKLVIGTQLYRQLVNSSLIDARS